MTRLSVAVPPGRMLGDYIPFLDAEHLPLPTLVWHQSYLCVSAAAPKGLVRLWANQSRPAAGAGGCACAPAASHVRRRRPLDAVSTAVRMPVVACAPARAVGAPSTAVRIRRQAARTRAGSVHLRARLACTVCTRSRVYSLPRPLQRHVPLQAFNAAEDTRTVSSAPLCEQGLTARCVSRVS
jgi:hypothetical protein